MRRMCSTHKFIPSEIEFHLLDNYDFIIMMMVMVGVSVVFLRESPYLNILHFTSVIIIFFI